MTFSPWIARNPVDGDDCPVPGQKVQAHYSLQTRDQAELSAVQSADDLPWNHSGNPIIAYRCVICETSRATPLVPPAVMVGDGEVDALLIRLTAPHYWMSGSDQGHEGENSAAYEAAALIDRLRTELIEAQVELAKADENINVKADWIDKTINDMATRDATIAALETQVAGMREGVYGILADMPITTEQFEQFSAVLDVSLQEDRTDAGD